jgi:hypothetical protein
MLLLLPLQQPPLLQTPHLQQQLQGPQLCA